MKRWMGFVIGGLVFVAVAASAFSPDWGTCRLERQEKNGSLVVRKGTRLAGVFSVKPFEAVNSLQVSTEPGLLVVDTAGLRKKFPKAEVIFRAHDLPFTPAHRLQNMRLELAASSQPGGLPAKLYFEGTQGEKKKHFWKVKQLVLSGEDNRFSFDQILPGDLNDLHLRFDLSGAGIYRIGRTGFAPAAGEKVNPAKNWLTNGGAELGWFNVSTFSGRTGAMADDGRIYDGYGKVYRRAMAAAVDSRVKHSGRNSFRLEAAPDSTGYFCYNSVPFQAGAPMSFSVWLKAEKPKTKVTLGLYLASGIAYGREVTVGTEWKRYDLSVPRWGEKDRGSYLYGDAVNGYGSIFHQVTPRLIPSAGSTVWADDAACHLGAARDAVYPAISVAGKLNHTRGYCFAGEPVVAEFSVVAPGKRELPVRWELLDFRGRRIGKAVQETWKLDAAGQGVSRCTLPLPEEFRGSCNWNFSIGDVKYSFQFGVIDRPGKQLTRLGINYDSRQNAETAIAMLKDFRFGAVRMWSDFRNLPTHGFRDVPFFHRNGFRVMMCVGMLGADVPRFLAPADWSDWKSRLALAAAGVKGMVDSYEIFNESNIWGGRTRVTDPAKHREMTPEANAEAIRAAEEVLKKVDPAALVAGPASCHTDISWTDNVLAKGAVEALSIITEHPYRALPELPDYAEDLVTLRKLADRRRPGLILVASEAGERGVALPRGEQIAEWERSRAAYNTRMMLIAFAYGVKEFHHFSMDQTACGTGWSMILAGNPATGDLARPAPVMFALRNAADRLEEAVPAGRVRLGSDYRGYLFDRGDRRVAVLWKWNGKPVRASLPEACAGKVTVFDFMGTRQNGLTLELDEFPVYLETAAAVDELKQWIGALELGGTRPLDAALEVSGESSFRIRLFNGSNRPVSGRVKVLTPNVVKGVTEREFPAIPAEESRSVEFQTVTGITPTDRPFELEVIPAGGAARRVRFNLRSILVPKLANAPSVDGRDREWSKMIPLRLTSAQAVRLAPWTPQEDRIQAEMRLGWDENYLYLVVAVDKADVVESAVGPSGLWSGDSLQIAFDPLRNATKDLQGYQDDDYEFAVGLWQGKPVVYMLRAAAALYDSVDKQLGVVPSVKSAIRVENGRTVYELAFPRLLVSPFRLQAGSAMRFSLLVNVNNGRGRAGWLELTPGIGQTPKQPGNFIDLVLLPEAR